MTSVLSGPRTALDAIGDIVGRNISQNLPGAVQQGYQRQLGMNALDKAQQDVAQAGGDPFKIAMAFARAGAQNPALERALGPLLNIAMTQSQARNSQNAPMAGEESLNDMVQRTTQGSPQQQLPQFLEKPQDQGQINQNFPNNIGPQGGVGNVPQAATTGVKVPIPTPQEQLKEARSLAGQRTKAGIPTTVKEALEEVKSSVEDKKAHNLSVDEELKQRVGGQKTYGGRAVDYLKEVYPEASPELQTIFQKKGEEASRSGDSEAEINRFLSKEAKNFKNAIVNVEKDLSAPRLINSITRGLEGTYKDFNQSAADARKNIQPLLDLGLYDFARNLLAEKGYGIEERDIIINPLNSKSQSIMNQLPKLKQTLTKPYDPNPYETVIEPKDIENLKDSLIQLKQADNNFSLPLARKFAEDKGYDWRTFKDSLNSLLDEGYELTDDQNIQKGNLDTPPLNRIEKFLHGLNLIGR